MTPRPVRLLHDALIRTAERAPDKPAVIADGQVYTYRKLFETARRLAGALRARGLERGDRVAIYMENRWECAVSIYGAAMAGGAFMVLNPQTKRAKLEHILADSEAAFLLTEARLLGALGPGGLPRGSLRGTLCAGAVSSDAEEAFGPGGLESFEGALAGPESDASSSTRSIPLDLAALIYTSGSTGLPKGVMMTHEAMVFTCGSLVEYLRLGDDHRILNVLPLAFDYGLYQLLMSVHAGATLVLERSFAYVAQTLQRVEEHAVTVFPGVPTMFAMLVSQHRKRPLSLPSVTRVTNTAAALPDSTVSALREVFRNAWIFKMYGLTECKRVCYLEPDELEERPGSVGKAIPGTETLVLSPDGREVAPHEVGILHVRGPHVMLGYWKRPDLSAEMLKPGRYPGERILCTHDHFRVDEDGYLYFVGRTDDIIKTRGEKVSPVEVENALCALPGVREAAVIGVEDPVLGQAVRAYVVLEDGAALGDKELKHLCSQRLEAFMVPRDVVFLRELPKTDTGKVRKRSLADTV